MDCHVQGMAMVGCVDSHTEMRAVHRRNSSGGPLTSTRAAAWRTKT